MENFSLANVAQAGVITDAPSLSSVGINVLNFLLSVFGIVAIIMLVFSAVVYLSSAGREELNKKAKRSMTYSIIGVAAAMGALIVIRLLGKFLQ